MEWNDYECFDKVLTSEELKIEMDKEYENMSEEEKYCRTRDCCPTFLQMCCTFMFSNKLEKIIINEFTYKIEKISDTQ